MSEVKYTEAEIEKIKDRILEALEMVIDLSWGLILSTLALFTISVSSKMAILKSI